MERLFPVVKRFLGRDENYDLRIDAAMVGVALQSHDHSNYLFAGSPCVVDKQALRSIGSSKCAQVFSSSPG